ncbi:MAG: arylsulfatase [Ignavibacterium sp.]|nr:MAG: arylsulfatase [Ignavibacterium sp.]
MRKILITILLLLGFSLSAQDKPNIVLIFMDNFGWGELGCYGGGILRGAPTPRIDKLADEGMRLLNFNVEAQCTPSRAAIMTGRYAIRTGNAEVPLGVGEYGLTQWEYTMPEMLKDAGYVTGMFGKWHLGDSEGRYPTDQGFDEWYGIPNSSDESYWPDNDLFIEGVTPQVKYEYVMEAKRGEKPENIKVYNSAQRLMMDREITDKAKDFIKRKAKGDQPFFCFIPYTQTHLPVEPEPTRKGSTGNGKWGDVLAQLDDYVGELLDVVDQEGIKENTIFIFTADNGPEAAIPHQGFAGPWRGSYFTGLEGSLRVPFIIRWPGKIPAKTVSNEIVHEMDLYSTFANIAGGKIPSDRIIDSKDMTDFFMGKNYKSGREEVIIYVGRHVYGVKWRNWKMMTKELDKGFGVPPKEYSVPLFYNLHLDPREEYPVLNAPPNFWVRYPAGEALLKHLGTFKQEPPIPPFTPDPYLPEK